MLFALETFLPALIEVCFRLPVPGLKRRQPFLRLGQRHLGGRACLLVLLPLLISFADLAGCLLEATLNDLDLAFRCLGALVGTVPGLLQVFDLLLDLADLTLAEDHFFVQAIAALTVLTKTRTQVGSLFGQYFGLSLERSQ